MKKIITYGTFDLFHKGHYNIIKRAKELGDYLIVGVTSESYDIERGKLNVQDSLLKRIENVRNTGLADEIIIEEYQGQKINDVIKYNIDKLVIGSDWRGKFDYLNNYCEVEYLERTKDISSTQIRESQSGILNMGIITDDTSDNGTVFETKFISGIHVESVFSNDESVAKEFCEKYELDKYYTSLDDFFPSIDMVYIKCKREDRAALIESCLKSKKHVICDAPFTLDPQSLKNLQTMAEENNVMLIDNVILAYLRAFTQLVWLLKGDLIGEILSVRCSVSLEDFNNSDDILDLTLYPIFAVLKLLGMDYEQLSYNSICDDDGNMIYNMVHFNYDRAVANIEIVSSDSLKNEMVLIGTKGRVEIPDKWWDMGYFEAITEGSKNTQRYSFNFEGNGFRYLLQEFLIMIKDERVISTRLFPNESAEIVTLLNKIFS